MEKNIITDNGYSVEQSITGYWRLMKGEEVIFDDSACEDLNGDREMAEAFFTEWLNENMDSYTMEYGNAHVSVIEDTKYYHINFRTGLGEAHYPKCDWTLEDALKDQTEI